MVTTELIKAISIFSPDEVVRNFISLPNSTSEMNCKQKESILSGLASAIHYIPGSMDRLDEFTAIRNAISTPPAKHQIPILSELAKIIGILPIAHQIKAYEDTVFMLDNISNKTCEIFFCYENLIDSIGLSFEKFVRGLPNIGEDLPNFFCDFAKEKNKTI